MTGQPDDGDGVEEIPEVPSDSSGAGNGSAHNATVKVEENN